MTEITKDRRLLETFASLADTLVEGYDVVELLQLLVDTCHDLLDATAAAILLEGPGGELEVIATTSEASTLVEMIQLGAEAGPCIESFRTGQAVSLSDIAESPDIWAAFREAALAQGFRSVLAIPMRLREVRVGTLNLFRDQLGGFDATEQIAAGAFADVATIGILHERSLREQTVLTEQLSHALSSRVVIEQAKGVVAQIHGVPIDDAFDLIRQYARAHQLRVVDVASRLVDRTLTLAAD